MLQLWVYYEQYQSCEQSNQVKELILKEEEEERNAGSLEDPPRSFQVECRGTMHLEVFGESEEENEISILSNLGTYSSAEIKKLAEQNL